MHSRPSCASWSSTYTDNHHVDNGSTSALTGGYWGHFSERNGRTRVLALTTLGLLLTDLTYILVSTPGLPFSSHGHILLVIAPFLEGLCGGFATLQSTCTSYVSDCTSSGSRATIFSRFTGVLYLGLSVGPTLGGWIINNGLPGIDRIGTPTGQGKSVTEVFWLAITFSLINLLLVLFVFPDSLSRERKVAAGEQYRLKKGKGPIVELFRPLAVFKPRSIRIITPTEYTRRKDWSLTFLAISLFLYMLSTGVYGTKYLYAVHTYSWAADQLSYYISFSSGMRAITTLVIIPSVISSFKPKPDPEVPQPEEAGTSDAVVHPNGKKPKPKMTQVQIRREIKFDRLLTRISLLLDLLGHVLIIVFPAPSAIHSVAHPAPASGSATFVQSEILFVVATAFNSMSAGVTPAIQSLALCVIQARDLIQEDNELPEDGTSFANFNPNLPNVPKENVTGKLFGALSTLQALGQMIIGPIIFGLVYSETVAYFPKAIFIMATVLLAGSLGATVFIRNPVEGERRAKRRAHDEEERGRSRTRKDLFHGTDDDDDEDEDDAVAAYLHQSTTSLTQGP